MAVSTVAEISVISPWSSTHSVIAVSAGGGGGTRGGADPGAAAGVGAGSAAGASHGAASAVSARILQERIEVQCGGGGRRRQASGMTRSTLRGWSRSGLTRDE